MLARINGHKLWAGLRLACSYKMASSTLSASLSSQYQDYLDHVAGVKSSENHAPLSLL